MLRAYKFRLWTNANQERELEIALEDQPLPEYLSGARRKEGLKNK
jgi:hypothetical protein